MSCVKQTYFTGKGGWMRCDRHDMSAVGDVIVKTWFRGPDTEHSIFMMWGRVLITPTREDPLELQSGARCDWPAGAEYEVKALEAPVRFYSQFGPNAGLVNYNRLCPNCRALKFKTPTTPMAAILPPSSTLVLPPRSDS